MNAQTAQQVRTRTPEPASSTAIRPSTAVQHGDSLLLTQPDRKEPMMEMPLVGMERALPVDYPAEEGESRVRQRHCERQQRHEEGYYGMEFEHAEDGDR